MNALSLTFLGPVGALLILAAFLTLAGVAGWFLLQEERRERGRIVPTCPACGEHLEDGACSSVLCTPTALRRGKRFDADLPTRAR